MPTSRPNTVNKRTKRAAGAWTVETALARVRWIARYGDGAIARLATGARLIALGTGEVALRRGVANRHLVVLVEGSLETATSAPSGRRMVIGFVEPGMVVGLVSLFDAKDVFQDARARAPSVVLMVPKASLMDAVREVPGFAEAVIRVMAQRMRIFLGAMADRALLPLPVRLAQLVVTLASAQGKAPAAGDEVRVGQEELGAMLGVSRQYLNPALRRFEREGLIAIGYARLVVRDARGLARLAAQAGR